MPAHLRAFAVSAALLAATACSRSGSDPNAFHWTASIPAGSTVHFRNVVGNVVVNTTPGQSASVLGSKSWRRGGGRDLSFSVSQSGNDYYICAMWRGSGSCDADGYRARTTNGWLTMFSLFHRGSSSVAAIAAELPANVAVDASTVDGSVAVSGTTAGVIAKTANGGVTATNVSGSTVLSTINGAVKLTAVTLGPTDSVHLNAVNGVVTAELPAGLEGDYDLRTTNGVVKTNLPLTSSGSANRRPRHLSGRIGNSTRPVRAHATNGVVTVTEGPAAASSR